MGPVLTEGDVVYVIVRHFQVEGIWCKEIKGVTDISTKAYYKVSHLNSLVPSDQKQNEKYEVEEAIVL